MMVSLQKWLGGAAVSVRVLCSSCLRPGNCWAILALVVLLSRPVSAEEPEPEEVVRNPHGDPTLCDSCHAPVADGRRARWFDGDVSQLCQSCHEGRLAKREVHPVNRVPSDAISQRIPSDFPLRDGMVTCLTCHDVAQGCTAEAPNAAPGRNLLRGGQAAQPLMFCFHCHGREDYGSFNVHDQLEAGEMKVDTCLWCHTSVPDANSSHEGEAPYLLRGTLVAVCHNCHRMAGKHPAGSSHVNVTARPEMIWQMSAYEMRTKMRLSFPELLEYARVTKRFPRSMPLDENNRITCCTCHNPHAKGLFPTRNPRSVGAEPRHAVNHRLRAREGSICVACHQK